MAQNDEQWGSRWGFIAAAIGMAAGTGNIWRFPRVCVKNGGGTFIIAWVVALFVWSIPLLISEMVIGRKAKLGTIGAFKSLGNKSDTWMGGWIAWVCIGIMGYYSVVMGWTIKYFILGVTGNLTTKTHQIWSNFISSPDQTILFHFVAIFVCTLVIYKGVTEGIEKVTKILVPSLLIILVVCAIRALFLPGSQEGINYLFNVDLVKLLSPKIWLEAFTQSAWSTGAGWGFIITYAVYTRRDEDIGMNCFITGLGNSFVSIIAALGIVPTIFALSSDKVAMEAINAGNTGLAFIYYPKLFPTMPGGKFLAGLFFLAMMMAALTSLIAMFEVAVKNLIDYGMGRQKASIITGLGAFILGLPSAFNIKILNNQDFVWGVGLLVSGLFVSMLIIRFGAEKLRKNEINIPSNDLYIGKWWTWCIRIVPGIFIILFGWWIWQSISWYPESWWNPFREYSLGTIVLQYIIILIVLIYNNRWFTNNVVESKSDSTLNN
ncbi:sodium-dependent transporter [Sporohalobacter salinus]|uniref:sodium-dependent transporter n=1 Tax=Sporohalobacter salinus TaxID=1494606 RepID=UPI001960B67E|nr:sodium-dependent transporter [Sporohalobacter salinus]MBM7622540.1 NSS family neurotransmitter:Na+ symporter [Sporohalobacter salinus]